ncbi:hypothetical protein Desca_0643 [Desulfotomaculum nigrificans CO-1-SRB]|uniref:Helix-turn-helix type 11 domain-containing protein n=1 Tax=Desulfotomaculum nigrificans (strain DSM 14880 / VKM B-2319 / CO-1-SRB) TaxID=868595 RepID=F6B885_DESCC|nr:HTH domain-containing protein [Desulfotomaculum nigrificans]AEF93530.1 hypothetical protein Desca_0643 [Desulfotomaculum nigrificans CO-1-SRB]
MNLIQLVETYLATKQGNRKKLKAQLDRYIGFLNRENLMYYYQVLNSDKLESGRIKEDLLDFMLDHRGAQSKEKALKAVVNFWNYLYKEGIIPANPVAGVSLELVGLTSDQRRLQLVKFIQGKEKTIREIQQHFFVSERTIREDIKALREGRGLWNYTKIDEMRTEDGAIRFSSSIHPLFLTLNLTSLVELMMGIQEVLASNIDHKKPFELIYRQIWPQLTEYAKEHLARTNVTAPSGQEVRSFIDEPSYLRDSISSKLVYSIKGKNPVNITVEKDGVELEQEVLVFDNYSDQGQSYYKFRVLESGEEFAYPLSDIKQVKTARENRD